MSEPNLSTESANRAPLRFGEFVTLIASMMALTALGIDSMLPALPAIGDSLGVGEPNHRQFVITAFLLGFAFAQLAPDHDAWIAHCRWLLAEGRAAAPAEAWAVLSAARAASRRRDA